MEATVQDLLVSYLVSNGATHYKRLIEDTLQDFDVEEFFRPLSDFEAFEFFKRNARFRITDCGIVYLTFNMVQYFKSELKAHGWMRISQLINTLSGSKMKFAEHFRGRSDKQKSHFFKDRPSKFVVINGYVFLPLETGSYSVKDGMVTVQENERNGRGDPVIQETVFHSLVSSLDVTDEILKGSLINDFLTTVFSKVSSEYERCVFFAKHSSWFQITLHRCVFLNPACQEIRCEQDPTKFVVTMLRDSGWLYYQNAQQVEQDSITVEKAQGIETIILDTQQNVSDTVHHNSHPQSREEPMEKVVTCLLLSYIESNGETHYKRLIEDNSPHSVVQEFFKPLSNFDAFAFFKRNEHVFNINKHGIVFSVLPVTQYFQSKLKACGWMSLLGLFDSLEKSEMKFASYFHDYSESEKYCFFGDHPSDFVVIDDYVFLSLENVNYSLENGAVTVQENEKDVLGKPAVEATVFHPLASFLEKKDNEVHFYSLTKVFTKASIFFSSGYEQCLFFAKHPSWFQITLQKIVSLNPCRVNNIHNEVINFLDTTLEDSGWLYCMVLKSLLQKSNSPAKFYFDAFKESDIYWFFKERPSLFSITNEKYVHFSAEKECAMINDLKTCWLERGEAGSSECKELESVINFLVAKLQTKIRMPFRNLLDSLSSSDLESNDYFEGLSVYHRCLFFKVHENFDISECGYVTLSEKMKLLDASATNSVRFQVPVDIEHLNNKVQDSSTVTSEEMNCVKKQTSVSCVSLPSNDPSVSSAQNSLEEEEMSFPILNEGFEENETTSLFGAPQKVGNAAKMPFGVKRADELSHSQKPVSTTLNGTSESNECLSSVRRGKNIQQTSCISNYPAVHEPRAKRRKFMEPNKQSSDINRDAMEDDFPVLVQQQEKNNISVPPQLRKKDTNQPPSTSVNMSSSELLLHEPRDSKRNHNCSSIKQIILENNNLILTVQKLTTRFDDTFKTFLTWDKTEMREVMVSDSLELLRNVKAIYGNLKLIDYETATADDMVIQRRSVSDVEKEVVDFLVQFLTDVKCQMHCETLFVHLKHSSLFKKTGILSLFSSVTNQEFKDFLCRYSNVFCVDSEDIVTLQQTADHST